MNELAPLLATVEAFGPSLHGKIAGAAIITNNGTVYADAVAAQTVPHAVYVAFSGLPLPPDLPAADIEAGRTLQRDAILPNGVYLKDGFSLDQNKTLYRCTDGTVYVLRWLPEYSGTTKTSRVKCYARKLAFVEAGAEAESLRLTSDLFPYSTGVFLKNGTAVNRWLYLEVTPSPTGRNVALTFWGHDRAASSGAALPDPRFCGWRPVTGEDVNHVNGCVFAGLAEATIDGGDAETFPTVTVADTGETLSINGAAWSFGTSNFMADWNLGDFAAENFECVYVPVTSSNTSAGTHQRHFLAAAYDDAGALQVFRSEAAIIAFTTASNASAGGGFSGSIAAGDYTSVVYGSEVTHENRKTLYEFRVYQGSTLRFAYRPMEPASTYQVLAQKAVAFRLVGGGVPFSVSVNEEIAGSYINGVAVSAGEYLKAINSPAEFARVGSNVLAVFTDDQSIDNGTGTVTSVYAVHQMIDEAGGLVVPASSGPGALWPDLITTTADAIAAGFGFAEIYHNARNPAGSMWGVFNRRTGAVVTGAGENWI